jgi:hypothetical protein
LLPENISLLLKKTELLSKSKHYDNAIYYLVRYKTIYLHVWRIFMSNTMMIIIVVYGVLSVLIAVAASKKGRPAIKCLLVSLLLTPLAGGMYLWFTKADPEKVNFMMNALRKCPFCARHVPPGLLRCPHCNKEVPEDLNADLKSLLNVIHKMSIYKIKCEDGVVKWKDRVFNNVPDAIAAADEEEKKMGNVEISNS